MEIQKSRSVNTVPQPILRGAPAALRKIYTYRAWELWAHQTFGRGAKSYWDTQRHIERLGNFATHDQDAKRDPLGRKFALSNVNQQSFKALTGFVRECAQKDRNNVAVIQQLRKVMLAIVGERESAEDALTYIKRSSLRLHPDKATDLEGWELPGVTYSRLLPADYRFEHAKQGALAMLELHNALKDVLRNKHYADLLFTPSVVQGGKITVGQAAKEWTIASVFAGVIGVSTETAAAAGCLSGAGFAVLLVWYACALVAAKKKQQQQQSRELVLHRSSHSVRTNRGILP